VDHKDDHRQTGDERRSLLSLAATALIVGAVTGCVGAIFRLLLVHADRLRDTMITWAHGHTIWGFLIVVGACAVATLFAAWLVRQFSPHASGSGIPHVKAVLREEIPPAPLALIPVKFLGGLLAIGSGLALGREGPTVQMGAGIAVSAVRVCRLGWADARVLLAAGAGAGLATAFNAPIAGLVFVLEELVERFDHRIAVATLAALATAIPVARLLLGDAPDFQVESLNYARPESVPLFFVLGAIAGLLAIAYNRALLAGIAVRDRFGRLTIELRAGLIGRQRRHIGVVRSRPGRWWGSDHATGADRFRRPRGRRVCIPDPVRARRSLIRRRHVRGVVRALTRAGSPVWTVVRRGLPLRISIACYPAPSICSGGHGRLLHRRGACTGDRHRSRRRNDR
jgi:chloride channel protein, CIC family